MVIHMFEALTERLGAAFGRLRGRGRLTEADVDAALAEVRVALLEADVHVDVVRSLLDRVRGRALGAEVMESLTPAQQVVKIVRDELIATLGTRAEPLAEGRPLVILMVGLQGSGKTTTAAKLARMLARQKRNPLLVAADLQRPAAVDQLETLGRAVGVPVFSDKSSRPRRVVRAALKHARQAGHDALVIDTAGRLQIDDRLMDELADIRREARPQEVLLVVDAMTGQDAVNVARGFAERVGVTGVVLSKLDGDARGGAAISIRQVTGVPVKLVGVGEHPDALEPFHPDRMAGRILGMGDVLSLIEKAEETFDHREAERAARKLEEGSFDLDDFLSQFQMLKRMGSLKDILAMLPGAAGALRGIEVDDRDLRRVEAIIRSMTPEERRNPKIIDGSRRRRIAAGSGTNPQDVNRLLRQFAEAQRMMKQLSGGRGLPTGAGRGRRGQTKRKKRKR